MARVYTKISILLLMRVYTQRNSDDPPKPFQFAFYQFFSGALRCSSEFIEAYSTLHFVQNTYSEYHIPKADIYKQYIYIYYLLGGSNKEKY